jgi:hypothetical protein
MDFSIHYRYSMYFQCVEFPYCAVGALYVGLHRAPRDDIAAAGDEASPLPSL